jgi:4-amino-4-deoxy-L-arabinose transferase-like glycosyltransferase
LTSNRLGAVILAFILGAGGQILLDRDLLWAGAVLYGVALLLLVWGARPASASRPANPLSGLQVHLQIQSGAAKGLGLAAVVGVLLFSVLAYRTFDQQSTRAWIYYLAGLAYLLVATLLLTRGEGLGHLWPRTRITRWLLVMILLLALALRVWKLGSLPEGTWYDEALSGLQGVRWNQDLAFRPQFENTTNNPGQIVFLYATALRWLGYGTLSIRLVSAVLGLAGVLVAYLFGSELRGPRFGLAMAFLTAVARWHIVFSRIAMPGIDAPLFVFLSLFFLTRLLRGGRLRDAVWAGVALGLGLSVYSAFRLFIVAIGLFSLLSLLAWRRWVFHPKESKWWPRLGVRLAALGLALWLAALPVLHFALSEPNKFWDRVRNTSIFHTREEPDLGAALRRTAIQHLQMFNVAGDRNGRHNLFGEPTLDPAMGVLFVLGLGLAVARIREPVNLFFVILLPVGLLGGILSLDFEAPQSLRSIVALPAVIYFCASSLATLGRQVEASLRPRLSAFWLAVPALALGGYILLYNAHTYFVRQAGDFCSWSAFSAAESIAGKRMAELGPEYTYYLSPLFGEHPSIRFLSPETQDRRLLTVPDALPIRQPADRPAALIIHPDDRWTYETAQVLYPGGEFETFLGPTGQTPVLYVVRLERADIAWSQGLELRTWFGESWNEQPQIVTRVNTVGAGWPTQSTHPWPSASTQRDTFALEWSGVLYAPKHGAYRFALRAPLGATFDLDGQAVPVIEEGSERTASLELAQGNHHLRIRALSRPGQVSLSWQPPGGEMESVPQWALYVPPATHNGLQGHYYSNATWEGSPVLVQIDPFLDTYFHLSPLPRPYSAEWTGTLQIPQSGTYRLGLRAVDWAQLYIDGEVIVETGEPDAEAVETVVFTRGLYDLRVRFRDTVGRSRLHLLWQPPGQETPTVIPSQHLWPSRASLIEAAPAETRASPIGAARRQGKGRP